MLMKTPVPCGAGVWTSIRLAFTEAPVRAFYESKVCCLLTNTSSQILVQMSNLHLKMQSQQNQNYSQRCNQAKT